MLPESTRLPAASRTSSAENRGSSASVKMQSTSVGDDWIVLPAAGYGAGQVGMREDRLHAGRGSCGQHAESGADE